MTTKRTIKNGVEQLKNQTSDEQDTEIAYYEHPETGVLHTRYKQPIDEPTGFVIHLSWNMAPFVVERETADSEGWDIVESVSPEGPSRYTDPVEVSEWCANPWVSDPEGREVVSE